MMMTMMMMMMTIVIRFCLIAQLCAESTAREQSETTTTQKMSYSEHSTHVEGDIKQNLI